MANLGPLRELTFQRAGDRCETIFEYGNRCRNQADELHHRVPRAAGGNQLDKLATAALKAGNLLGFRHLAHLIALCSVCHHEVAHGDPKRAAHLGLRVLGQMRHERWSGETYYEGPDETFAQLWPKGVAA